MRSESISYEITKTAEGFGNHVYLDRSTFAMGVVLDRKINSAENQTGIPKSIMIKMAR